LNHSNYDSIFKVDYTTASWSERPQPLPLPDAFAGPDCVNFVDCVDCSDVPAALSKRLSTKGAELYEVYRGPTGLEKIYDFIHRTFEVRKNAELTQKK
jgi:hypothetical protein